MYKEENMPYIMEKNEKRTFTIPNAVHTICEDCGLLSRDEWLAARAAVNGGYGIGGSDCAAIMGDGFVTPLDLYNRIRGIPMKPRKMPENALEEGHRYEHEIAEKFCIKAGYTLIESPELIQSVEHPHMFADFDFLCIENKTGKIKGLEIKHTDAMNFDFQRNMRAKNPPNKYVWQVRHYMAVSGIDEWIIALGWHAGDVSTEITNVEWASVKRDLDIEKFMIEEQEDFIRATRAGILPELEGYDEDLALDALARTYGAGDGSDVEFADQEMIQQFIEYEKACISAKEAKKKHEAAEEYQKLIAVKIREKMAAATTAEVFDPLSQDRIKVGIITRNKTIVKEDELMRENPDIYKECMEFKPAILKESFKAVYKQYTETIKNPSELLSCKREAGGDPK